MFACLVSIHSKMWIQQQTSFLHQRLVSLAWLWCYGGSYFSRNIRLSTLGVWTMYSSDPRTDTGSLMQLESRRAVPQASKPPIIQSLSQDILIIPQLDGREVKKPMQTSGSRTFLSFSCFPIANQESVSRSAALLLRIKAFALQKRLFVLFALVGRTAAILDVAMFSAVEGAQCKTGELP